MRFYPSHLLMFFAGAVMDTAYRVDPAALALLVALLLATGVARTFWDADRKGGE